MTITLNNYAEASITQADTVIKAQQIQELRNNVQVLVNGESAHYRTRGDAVHGVVTASHAGFAPKDILSGLDNLEARLRNLGQRTDRAFPIGAIAIWGGNINLIPSDWRICDGSGPTPDLRNKFILGARDTSRQRADVGSDTFYLDNSSLLQRHRHHFFNICHETYNSKNTSHYTDVTTYWTQDAEIHPTGNICANPPRGDAESYDCACWTIPDYTDFRGSGTTGGGYTIDGRNPFTNRIYIMKVSSTNQEIVPDYVSVTLENAGNGALYFTNGSASVIRGSTIQVHAEGNSGYYLNALYVNGNRIGTPADYAMVVTGPTTIRAEFVAISHGIASWGEQSDGAIWTVPDHITRIRVTTVGGGGGGVCIRDNESGNFSSRNTITDEYNFISEPFQVHPEGIAGGNGTASYVSNPDGSSPSVVANGGTGGFFLRGTAKDDNTWYIKTDGSSVGGSPNGRNGSVTGSHGSGNFSCAGGDGFSVATSIQSGDFGQGGDTYVGNNNDSWTDRWYASGGSGGWNQDTYNVGSGQQIMIHVGKGGYGRQCDCWGPHHDNADGDIWAHNGNGGFVIIEWGLGI